MVLLQIHLEGFLPHPINLVHHHDRRKRKKEKTHKIRKKAHRVISRNLKALLLGNWSLIRGGGGLQNGMLRGGTTSFGVVFMR